MVEYVVVFTLLAMLCGNGSDDGKDVDKKLKTVQIEYKIGDSLTIHRDIGK